MLYAMPPISGGETASDVSPSLVERVIDPSAIPVSESQPAPLPALAESTGDGPLEDAADPSGTTNRAAPTASAGRGWALALRGLIGLVILAALAVVAASALLEPLSLDQALVALVMTGVATAYDVVARRIERVRRITSSGPYVTMGSVWIFGAALILPLPLVALMTILIYLQSELQARRGSAAKPVYRVLFNASVAYLCTSVAHVVVHWGDALGADQPRFGLGGWQALILIAALLACAATNTLLTGAALTLAGRTLDLRKAIGTTNDNLLELATLALGGLVAIAVTTDVWLVLLAVPAMVLLQRTALVEHLESAASKDGKTGLLNAAAWQHVAQREVLRAIARRTPATVLLVDLDHFKRVNDTYGHLTGDAVLRAVADCMQGMLRDRDLLSRFGGEEFVALLPGADAREAFAVAERLRARIADVVVTQVGDPPQAVLTQDDPLQGSPRGDGSGRIRVTVSVGLASFPDHAETLTGLLTKADTALYAAKHAGRNLVRTSA